MIGSFLTSFVFTHGTALFGGPRRKLRVSCVLAASWFHFGRCITATPPRMRHFYQTQVWSLSCLVNLSVSELLHRFVKVLAGICQSCYIDSLHCWKSLSLNIEVAILLTNRLRIDILDNRRISGPNVSVKKNLRSANFCPIVLKLRHLSPKAC